MRTNSCPAPSCVIPRHGAPGVGARVQPHDPAGTLERGGGNRPGQHHGAAAVHVGLHVPPDDARGEAPPARGQRDVVADRDPERFHRAAPERHLPRATDAAAVRYRERERGRRAVDHARLDLDAAGGREDPVAPADVRNARRRGQQPGRPPARGARPSVSTVRSQGWARSAGSAASRSIVASNASAHTTTLPASARLAIVSSARARCTYASSPPSAATIGSRSPRTIRAARDARSVADGRARLERDHRRQPPGAPGGERGRQRDRREHEREDQRSEPAGRALPGAGVPSSTTVSSSSGGASSQPAEQAERRGEHGDRQVVADQHAGHPTRRDPDRAQQSDAPPVRQHAAADRGGERETGRKQGEQRRRAENRQRAPRLVGEVPARLEPVLDADLLLGGEPLGERRRRPADRAAAAGSRPPARSGRSPAAGGAGGSSPTCAGVTQPSAVGSASAPTPTIASRPPPATGESSPGPRTRPRPRAAG